MSRAYVKLCQDSELKTFLTCFHTHSHSLSGLVRVGTTHLCASSLYRGHLSLNIAYLAWVHHFLVSGCRSSFKCSSETVKTDRRTKNFYYKFCLKCFLHRKAPLRVISHSLFVDCFQELSVSVWPGPIRTQTCDLAAVPHFQMHSHTPTLFLHYLSLSKFPSFFHCPVFFSIPVCFLWTTGNVSGSVRDPYCCLCPLFCHAGRIRNSYSCSAVTKAVWLWRSFPALVEEQQKSQTSATTKTKSYLSKPAKTKTSLSKIYEWQ